MTNGDIVAGRSMVNVVAVREICISIFQELGQLALLTAGGRALEQFEKRLDVKFDTKKGLISINAECEIVTHVGEVIFNLRITTQYKGV